MTEKIIPRNIVPVLLLFVYNASLLCCLISLNMKARVNVELNYASKYFVSRLIFLVNYTYPFLHSENLNILIRFSY